MGSCSDLYGIVRMMTTMVFALLLESWSRRKRRYLAQKCTIRRNENEENVQNMSINLGFPLFFDGRSMGVRHSLEARYVGDAPRSNVAQVTCIILRLAKQQVLRGVQQPYKPWYQKYFGKPFCRNGILWFCRSTLTTGGSNLSDAIFVEMNVHWTAM